VAVFYEHGNETSSAIEGRSAILAAHEGLCCMELVSQSFVGYFLCLSESPPVVNELAVFIAE
jgi:hypothetical protein